MKCDCLYRRNNKKVDYLIHDRANKQMILERGYSCLAVYNYANDINTKIIRAITSPLYKGFGHYIIDIIFIYKRRGI